MLFSGNTVLAEPGMVFFLHCMVADSENGLALSLGCICLVILFRFVDGIMKAWQRFSTPR